MTMYPVKTARVERRTREGTLNKIGKKREDSPKTKYEDNQEQNESFAAYDNIRKMTEISLQ